MKKFSLLILLVCVICSGCFSLTSRFVANPLENIIKTIGEQPDPEIVKHSLATLIVIVDGLIASSPNNIDYLYAGTEAYTNYCQALE